jgi:hypothetical protein
LLFAAVSFVLILAVAPVALALPPSFSEPGPPLDLDPGPHPGDDELLRASILSIHAFVEKRKEPLRQLLANVKPVPVITAATAVAADQSTLAILRRRHMARLLLTYAHGEPQVTEAVRILIGSDETTRVLLLLNQRLPPLGRLRDSGAAALDAAEAVGDVLRFAVPLTTAGTCSKWNAGSSVAWAGTANDISVSVLAEAGQLFKNAREGIDPQSWGSCSSLWGKSYIAEMVGGQPVPGPGGDPKPHPNPPAVGSAYDETLFEHFVCGSSQLCDLKLLLHVTTTWRNTTGYLLQYHSPRQLSSAPPLVITDRGYVEAVENGSDVLIHSEKVFGFADPVTSAAIYLLLQAIEVSSYLAELVCCL